MRIQAEMKLAHISDLHIDEQHLTENILKTEHLLKFAAENGTDHLVVTGDISHLSKIQDLQIFRDLLSRFGFLHPDRLSMTIGNHDIFGGVHLAGDIVRFPRNYRLTNFKSKVQIFANYFKEAFQNTIPLITGSPFPYIKPLKNLLLIGLNTNMQYAPLRNLAASNGFVPKADQFALNRFLEKSELQNLPKLVLTHHHFTHKMRFTPDQDNRFFKWVENHTMRLRGRAALLRLFLKHKVGLVLHGHVHYNEEQTIAGIPFLGGGGSLKDDHDGKMKINFIHLDGHEVFTEITDIPVYVPNGSKKAKPIKLQPIVKAEPVLRISAI